MNVFHVEVVGGQGVGDGIFGEDMGVLDGVAAMTKRLSYLMFRLRRNTYSAYGVISSGSSSAGLYPSLAFVTAFRP